MPTPLIARLISPFVDTAKMRNFRCRQLKDAGDRAPKAIPNILWWLVHDGHVNGLHLSPECC